MPYAVPDIAHNTYSDYDHTAQRLLIITTSAICSNDRSRAARAVSPASAKGSALALRPWMFAMIRNAKECRWVALCRWPQIGLAPLFYYTRVKVDVGLLLSVQAHIAINKVNDRTQVHQHIITHSHETQPTCNTLKPAGCSLSRGPHTLFRGASWPGEGMGPNPCYIFRNNHQIN